MNGHESVTSPRTAARRSPLHGEHVALGATPVPFAGWLMPLRYTSDVAEHQAVRTAAGLFDLSHMGEIAVRGPDARAFADYALVGAISKVAVGRARYTMVCRPDGGVLDDLVVYRVADDELMIVANAANTATVLAALRTRAEGFDVVVRDDSSATALVAVQGPRAAQVLASTPGLALGPGFGELRYYACRHARFDGVPALVGRTGYTGEDGYEIWVEASRAVDLWRALLAAGRPHGLAPAGLAARDSLRLEAGMPLYGNELDRTTTPYDAGLGRVVALDKTGPDGRPCDFVGRAALARRAAEPPRRTLVGLAGQGRRAPRHGYPVYAAPEATAVGTVTSGAPSPTLGHPVAMAYVAPPFAAEGTELTVDVRGRAEPVRVVPLPFYRRPV
ncbi:MAG: glycine cleavage system aminomethyltransferase GcvT [Micrococcales bacterium]|nr:glycine cleavage system aminomethyltransferase GcvT [Micrococcales bacterium]